MFTYAAAFSQARPAAMPKVGRWHMRTRLKTPSIHIKGALSQNFEVILQLHDYLFLCSQQLICDFTIMIIIILIKECNF